MIFISNIFKNNYIISYLTAALRISSPWSDSSERSFEGLLRRAGMEKLPVSKVAILPFPVFQQVIEKFLLTQLDDSSQV